MTKRKTSKKTKKSSQKLTGKLAHVTIYVPGGIDYSDLKDDPRDISEIPEEERGEVSPFTLAMLGFNPRDYLDEKPRKKRKKIMKYEAQITFISCDNGGSSEYGTKEVVFNLKDGKIAMDFWGYTVSLNKAKDGYWTGKYMYHANRSCQNLACELFEREAGAYLLAGHWIEDGEIYKFFTEFNPI